MCNNSMPDQLDALRRIEVSMIACLEAEFLDTSAGNTEGDNEDDIDAVPVVDCNYVDPVDLLNFWFAQYGSRVGTRKV